MKQLEIKLQIENRNGGIKNAQSKWVRWVKEVKEVKQVKWVNEVKEVKEVKEVRISKTASSRYMTNMTR